MAKAGAFECLDKNRAKVYSNVEKIIAYSAQETQARNSSQISLFGDTVQATKFKMDEVPEWPHLEKLTMESEAIGFYLSAHPLDAFESVFERLRVSSSSDLDKLVQMAGASKVSLAAIVSDVREKISQKGNRFGIISATDKGGAFEVFTFAEALATNREKLKSGQPLLLNIMADKRPDDERVRLSLLSADYLNDIMSKTAASVIITVGSAECVPALARTIEQQPRGQSRVFIVVKTDEFDVEISLNGRYTIQGDAINHLQHMNGILEVRQV